MDVTAICSTGWILYITPPLHSTYPKPSPLKLVFEPSLSTTRLNRLFHSDTKLKKRQQRSVSLRCSPASNWLQDIRKDLVHSKSAALEWRGATEQPIKTTS